MTDQKTKDAAHLAIAKEVQAKCEGASALIAILIRDDAANSSEEVEVLGACSNRDIMSAVHSLLCQLREDGKNEGVNVSRLEILIEAIARLSGITEPESHRYERKGLSSKSYN